MSKRNACSADKVGDLSASLRKTLKIYTNRFFAKLVRRIFSLISRKMPGRITSSRIAVSEPNALDVMFSFQKNIQSKL